MHISEGILPASLLAGGYAGAIVGIAVGLRKMDFNKIAEVGLLSASFFVVSLIHLPIGFSNAHLSFSGLIGILLGWVSFPAIFTALIIQMIMFQYGGITTLGINAMVMGVPAVLCWYCFNFFTIKKNIRPALVALICGGFSVFVSSALVGISILSARHSGFKEVAVFIMIAHIPMIIVEGIVTACCVSFLNKVKPEILPNDFYKNTR